MIGPKARAWITVAGERLRDFWRNGLDQDTRDTICGLLLFGYLFGAVMLVNVLAG